MKNKRTTTKIIVNGEIWDVPRGFGALYSSEAEKQIAEAFRLGKIVNDIIGLMSLVGYAPTRAAVAGWSLRKRVEAVVYCSVVYARASDNPIQRHPELPWLPRAWQGPPADLSHIAGLRAAFAGPTPTEITG